MKRSGPPKRRAPLKRGPGPKRKTRISNRPKRQKKTATDWRRLPGWLDAVRELPCAHCGRHGPSDPAHVRLNGKGGIAYKPPDCYVLPLCRTCHDEQHAGRDPDSPTCWELAGELLRRVARDEDRIGGIRWPAELPPVNPADEMAACLMLAEFGPPRISGKF
jgi:hypothetical protein